MQYDQITASTTYTYNASNTLIQSNTTYQLPLDCYFIPAMTILFLWVTFFVATKLRPGR